MTIYDNLKGTIDSWLFRSEEKLEIPEDKGKKTDLEKLTQAVIASNPNNKYIAEEVNSLYSKVVEKAKGKSIFRKGCATNEEIIVLGLTRAMNAGINPKDFLEALNSSPKFRKEDINFDPPELIADHILNYLEDYFNSRDIAWDAMALDYL